MPLNTPFSLRDVSNQYGSNTRPATLSLRTFYVDIFGSAPAGSRLSDFNGYGQPSITNFVASTGDQDGGYVDLTFDVTRNSLDCLVIVEYHEDDGNPPFSGQSINTLSPVTYTTNGSKEIEVDTGDTDTLFQFRLLYYNEFNEDVDDRTDTLIEEATSSEPPQFATPIIDSAVNTASNLVEIQWSYGDEPSSFTAQFSDNSGGSWSSMTLQSSSNWGSGSNPKEGVWEAPVALIGPTDQVRIRANAEGGTTASEFSNAETIA